MAFLINDLKQTSRFLGSTASQLLNGLNLNFQDIFLMMFIFVSTVKFSNRAKYLVLLAQLLKDIPNIRFDYFAFRPFFILFISLKMFD